jgi:archaellin
MTKEFLEGIVGLREGIVLVALLLVGAIVAIDLFIPLPSKSSASICFVR